MPLTSSDYDDARFEDAEAKYGRLCPNCFGRLNEDDNTCDHCGWEFTND